MAEFWNVALDLISQPGHFVVLIFGLCFCVALVAVTTVVIVLSKRSVQVSRKTPGKSTRVSSSIDK
jgi:hypothetical protein